MQAPRPAPTSNPPPRPPTWSPPAGVLGAILRDTRDRVRRLRERAARLRDEAATAASPAPILPVLRGDTVAIIAEVKRRSPSQGVIREELAAATQAARYARGGAAAVSVLTEPISFGGSIDDLIEARRAVEIPLLRKDFILDALQLLESRAAGAAAVLLIARALEPGLLNELLRRSLELGLEPLVEVRSEQELALALGSGARLVGVNNRDLETLDVDPSTVDRLLPLVPRDVVAVAESGVRALADVERAARAGADAVLIGTALSAAGDPTEVVRGFTVIARQERRG